MSFYFIFQVLKLKNKTFRYYFQY